MLLLAWNATFPKYKFPIDKVCFYPIHKSIFLAQPNPTRYEMPIESIVLHRSNVCHKVSTPWRRKV